MEKNHQFVFTDGLQCRFLKPDERLDSEMHVNSLVPRNSDPNSFFNVFLKTIATFW